MAKPSLLELVQEILSDADADQVDSILDTVESDQCARVIRTVFENMVDEFDLSHHRTLKRLDATSSATPTIMTRPEGLVDIEWVQYDKKLSAGGDQQYKPVYWMEPGDFILRTSARTLSDSTVAAMTAPDSGHVVLIRNDKAPDWWTILEGYDQIVFDSYDSALETNLQQSKTLVYGVVRPTLSLTDAAIPDLPEHLMSTLKAKSRVLFFDLYKDGAPLEVQRLARRAEVRAMRHRDMTRRVRDEVDVNRPDYGRK